MTETMKRMVAFRNISVHDYEKVKPEILRSIVDHKLGDLEAFIAVIHNRSQTW